MQDGLPYGPQPVHSTWGVSVKGVLDLLARAKLIELSEEEKVEVEPAAPITMPAEEPAPPPPQAMPEGDAEIAEGRSLEEIFAAADLPPSPFPAERLLRLLDGLRAMDATTRKTAVQAMDAADDNWQIADPLLDAQRKIGVLERHKQLLAAQLRAKEQHTAALIEETGAQRERTTAEIRKQIHELEQLLEREVAKSTQEGTRLEAELRAAREAAAREGRRMDVEIDRLREIPAQFAQTTSES